MSRSIRLLNLLQYLREAKHPITSQTLAEQLGISQRSIYRDIDSLRQQGIQIDACAGLGFQLKDNFFLPPMTLNETEVESIFLALHWLKSVPDQQLQSASSSVLSKLNSVLPTHRQHLLEQTTLRAFNIWLPVDMRTLEQVRMAIRQQVKISILYGDETHQQSSRTLWPFAMGYFNDKIMLAAWCELRQAFRNFRIDRIQSLSLSQEVYPQFKQKLFREWWLHETQNPRHATDKD